jgi:hypothetical protein
MDWFIDATGMTVSSTNTQPKKMMLESMEYLYTKLVLVLDPFYIPDKFGSRALSCVVTMFAAM